MPRGTLYTDDDIKKIMALHLEGKNHHEIAHIIRPNAQQAWRKVKSIIDSNSVAAPAIVASPMEKQFINMGLAERTKYIVNNFAKSARGRAILNSLIIDEKSLFLEEYNRVHSEMESLTAAEDQMLIGGILSYILGLRAAQALAKCETIFRDVMEGLILPTDPKVVAAGRSEAHKAEMTNRMKDYREVMEKLKATRDKRLDRIRDTKYTFADLVVSMADKEYQESIIDDVIKLNRFEEAELKRLIEGGNGPDGKKRKWIMGEFDENKT